VGIDAQHRHLVSAPQMGTPTTVTTPAAAAALVALGRDRYLPVYRPRELVLERGQGARLWDSHGRDYIDFGAGIAVCGLGHCDPDLVAALNDQAAKLWHTSNVFYSEPPIRLADELARASRFATRVFLCNSGAEANEASIKLVRKWASAQGRAPERRVIVTCRGSFHGRTLAAVTATAQPKYQAGYEPLPGGFRYVDFNDIAQLEAAMDAGDVAAVMLEPVQGEGGVMPAADGYLAQVRALCDRHGALLVLDEIQCGMARTGPLFAHWHDGVTPDIVTLAKALGGGFPIGAMLSGPNVAEVMQFGDHGTTFGGNPLAAAVARVALRKLSSPDIASNVDRQAQALRDGLADIDRDLGLFCEIRGRGLMLGAVLRPQHAGKAGALLEAAAAHGLLLLQAGPDVLRFVPPLNISDDERAEGMARLRVALQRAMDGTASA
jgi:acetylornithine/N-succinyldiaminopimelate aminotransferase